MDAWGICRASFHCAYQAGYALVFGKGTTVSVSSSKYLVITDRNACTYPAGLHCTDDWMSPYSLTQGVLDFSNESH